MNSKNIARHLKNKMSDWLNHIEDASIINIILNNAIVTGGALVSLLNGEEPKDYDIYFKTEESCLSVAKYYAEIWNKFNLGNKVNIQHENGRITCFIKSAGIAEDTEESPEEYIEPMAEEEPKKKGEKKSPYRPTFFSTNAITLSDKIQLIIRFYGPVDEIHKNYDFVHCTCSYDLSENKVNLPAKALESIINKELHYIGSKYPLCSFIRTRKFIGRGYHINAGQYLKMAFQLNELNLKDFNVLKDQLAGVDSAYFDSFIDAMEKMKSQNPGFEPDNEYLFEVINRIFG